jgi:hypothetical protein
VASSGSVLVGAAKEPPAYKPAALGHRRKETVDLIDELLRQARVYADDSRQIP